MVEQQIQQRGIRDARVLSAMNKIPRERFVPSELASNAYNDSPLPIGFGQTISQPYIVAYMTEVATLPMHAKVLEIGTGSAYQASVLAEIADQVFSIEIVPELATQARVFLTELGYDNVTVREGDGYRGWAQEAPFDAIIVLSLIHI